MAGMQAALPREHYVDEGPWRHERDASWPRVDVRGRVHALGLDEAERLAVVEVLGESVLLTTDATGALHAHANVCRHRGARVVPAPDGDPPRAGPRRCAAGTTRGRTGSTAACSAPRTSTTSTGSTRPGSRWPPSRPRPGAGTCSSAWPAGPVRAVAGRELGAVADRTARYPLDRW